MPTGPRSSRPSIRVGRSEKEGKERPILVQFLSVFREDQPGWRSTGARGIAVTTRAAMRPHSNTTNWENRRQCALDFSEPCWVLSLRPVGRLGF